MRVASTRSRPWIRDYSELLICFEFTIKELKQRQRRRQRERHKFAYLVGKNNNFARPARAFFIFVHFFAVVSKTTTWNDQIWSFMKNVSTWG